MWDIHSPRVPSAAEMRVLLAKAAQVINPEKLSVNPDCGLKTRGWAEVEPALAHMVEAAKQMRPSMMTGRQVRWRRPPGDSLTDWG